jgi:O-antigen ligase
MHFIDGAIRFFICLAAFWIPYSPAVIEVCVVIALFLWIIKRGIKAYQASCSLTGWPLKIREGLKQFLPEPSSLNPFIGIFLIACVISVTGSSFFSIAVRGFFSKTLEWFVIYFLIIETFKTRQHLRIFLGVWIVTAVAIVIDSLIQGYVTQKDIFLGQLVQPGGRVTAGFRTPNGLGAYLTILIPVIFSFLLIHINRYRWVIFFSVFFLMSVWSLYLTDSRGAWLGVICGFILMAFFVDSVWKKEKVDKLNFILKYSRIIILAVTVMLLMISFYKNPSSSSRLNTVNWRLEIWNTSFDMIKDRPLFGHGINTYMRVFTVYRGGMTSPTYAHNCYIQLMAEVGAAGLLVFLALLGKFFTSGYQMLNKSSYDELKLCSVGLMGGVVAFLVHSFVDTNFYSLQLSAYLWVSIGIQMAIVQILNREVRHDKS